MRWMKKLSINSLTKRIGKFIPVTVLHTEKSDSDIKKQNTSALF